METGAFAIDPATGKPGERFAWMSAADVENRTARAHDAYRVWRESAADDRAGIFRHLGDYLRAHADRFARTMTAEMGKPIRQARGEVAKCAMLCDWYAENGAAMLRDESTDVGADAYISYLPLGVILAIAPWNYPLWQALRGTLPAILTGNAILFKHAPNCVRTALNVEEAFRAAGGPDGLFTVINVEPHAIEGVIADDRVQGVALTGSVRAGSAVAALAGRHIKKTVLELGGSDAFIVLADADLDRAVAAAVAARFQNSGQICIAAKRMIVERPVAQAFTEKLVAAVRQLKVGDPLDEATDIGPMARADLREELAQQVRRTIEQGATVALGAEDPADDDCYYAPTVLTGVRPGMAAFEEETFGPVAAIIVAEDADEAVALANDSAFGLAGAIWTADIALARQMARRIDTGAVFINGFAASDPRTPIGGVKKSGYGRELSYFGVREFANAQLVWKDRA